MSDLISRQAAIDAMESISDSICEQQAIDALCELPSAQLEIIRCKDCKWYDADGEEMATQGHCWYKNGEPVMQNMKPNDYCSYGEKKDG